MYIIKTSSDITFEQINGKSILDSAEKAGINLQYSCRTGRCSTCKCKVVKGMTKTYSDELGLTQLEKDEGYILSCVRYAEDNIEIEVDDLGDIEIPKPQTVPCKINKLKMLSEDVMQVILRIPPNTSFNFIPGQYLDLISPSGIKRSYSIANNITNNIIELHIKKIINGDFSNYLFKDAKLDDLLRLNGPHGTFFLREEADKDIIFLATGTGIAPIKSILESMEVLLEDDSRSISVIWGARKKSDLYLDYFDKNLNIDYIPVLSRASSDWTGDIGYVQDIAIEKKYDLTNTIVYACGSNEMIKSAKKTFIDSGLNKNHFYSDAFLASSDIIQK
jgi:CDP-4-dehydro-6-deoxyglucose reductase